MVHSRFTAEKGSFPGGELRLVCAATIDRVWNTHVEAVAMGRDADGQEEVLPGQLSGVQIQLGFPTDLPANTR